MYSAIFDLPAPPLGGGSFSLHIDHYQTDPDLGYYSHVYINGVDLGYLSSSTSTRWISQFFSGEADWLAPTGNTVAVNAAQVGSNLDDFEITNFIFEIKRPTDIHQFSIHRVFGGRGQNKVTGRVPIPKFLEASGVGRDEF